jgi:hypothetical protein
MVYPSKHVDGYQGVRIYVTPALPIYPSDVENARRIVRQGLSDVLAYLGEDVGPAPFEPIHMFKSRDGIFVSPETHQSLKESYSE